MKNAAARLWIMPAKESPVVLVIRRKPNKVWHFLRWDTLRGTVTSGGWLWGIFYPAGCDVSWDGRLWAYHADFGERGSGVAPIASLDPFATWYSYGAWGGGGFFDSATCLRHWNAAPPKLLKPDALDVHLAPESNSIVSGILSRRMKREGWQNDGGLIVWQQPSPNHPRLILARRETKDHGTVYDFSLPDYPRFLGVGVFRATYDAWGDLLVARRGVLERYTLADLERGTPSFAHDLNEIPDAPSRESLKRDARALWASQAEKS